jgi:ABC-type lipoprotein export system ATPase subunit
VARPDQSQLDEHQLEGQGLVVLRGVSRRFRTPSGAVVRALVTVDITVPARSLTVIAGPSGSGKSTLLGLVNCTDRADEGHVLLDGLDVGGLSRTARRGLRRTSLGTVLPQPSENLLDRFDAADNVRWVATHCGRAAPDVESMFALLGLSGCEHKRVHQLSGGEQQRVAIAAAMAGAPMIIAADEPTASLDRVSAGHVVDALRVATDAGATVMVATHDADVIAAADQVIHLDHGQVVS